MYDHPVAGRIANKDLVDHFAENGYIQDVNILPRLFSPITSNISFTLVVDDFGVKYTHDADLDALVSVLEKKQGIRLTWDYSANK